MKTVTAYLVVLAVCFLFGIGLMLTSPGGVEAGVDILLPISDRVLLS